MKVLKSGGETLDSHLVPAGCKQRFLDDSHFLFYYHHAELYATNRVTLRSMDR
jgi:hypothetical protein